jgi:hypothetical protein
LDRPDGQRTLRDGQRKLQRTGRHVDLCKKLKKITSESCETTSLNSQFAKDLFTENKCDEKTKYGGFDENV